MEFNYKVLHRLAAINTRTSRWSIGCARNGDLFDRFNNANITMRISDVLFT